MKIAIVLALGFAATTAFSAPIKPTYMINGKVVTPETALRAALANQDVMACKPVEAKLSKAGTSFGLRQKKARE